MPVPAFDPLSHRSPILLIQGIDQIHAGLIHRKDIRRCQDADIRCHHLLSQNPLAVAGHRNIPHDIDIADLPSEMIYGRLGGLADPFHQLLHVHTPCK